MTIDPTRAERPIIEVTRSARSPAYNGTWNEEQEVSDNASAKEIAEIVNGYFTAVVNRDGDGLRRVFAEDAVLQDPMGVRRGPDEIARGYEERFFGSGEFSPEPGPLLIVDDRAAVEIALHLEGEVVRLSDFFTIADGKITRLDIYRG